MRVLVVDALALVLYVVVSLPALTGVGVHEWLGLGVGVVLLVHGVQHIDFVGRLLAARCSLRATGRMLLDVALVLSVVVVALSGLMESGAVLPTFGLYAEGYYFWGLCMPPPPRYFSRFSLCMGRSTSVRCGA